jgi:dimethylhistidine N-methyltransferase
LFEQICETPEYYVTRTELALLRQVCPEVARWVGPSADVLEPGSGAGEKIRTLLDALEEPRSFIPIDISESAVYASARALARDYPDLELIPLVADFTKPFSLPETFRRRSEHAKMVFFPGSTISNFAPEDARTFLTTLKRVLSAGDFLFIGVDRIKDRKVLERAYDDEAGITAAFNLNLLDRIVRELDSDLDPTRFAHRAIYNEQKSRIEMHLESLASHDAHISGRKISFSKGETIHTENSYKYSIAGFRALAGRAGFSVLKDFSDERGFFSLYLCQVPD